MKTLCYLIPLACCLLLVGCDAPTSSLADEEPGTLIADASGGDHLSGTRFGKRIPSREGFGAGFPISVDGFHNRFAEVVRVRTEQFADVAVAEAAGYMQTGCGEGRDREGRVGGIGVSYYNDALVDAEIHLFEPEELFYHPEADGSLRLAGVGYLVSREAWEAVPGNEYRRPQLAGVPFSTGYWGSPDYRLHVWAHQENPYGPFTFYNPTVSCESWLPQP